MDGLAFERPWALWALALPPLVLLLARLRARPARRPTGTLELWRAIGHVARARGRRRGRRASPFVWLLAVALALGGLALAGPGRRTVEPPRIFRVVVDHSPSTGLPFDPARGDGPTRLERALDAAEAWLAEHVRASDRVRWISTARPTLELAGDEAPPAAWLATPRWHAPEPAFELHDVAGSLWVTDARPANSPRKAGVFASGGPRVSGPVAVAGDALLVQEGERLAEAPGAAGTRRLALQPDAASFPEPLRRMARVWARERGFVVAEGGEQDADLVLEQAASAIAARPVTAGRDGWSVVGEAPETGLAPPAGSGPAPQAWLTAEVVDAEVIDGNAARAPATLRLVDVAPGRVRVAWRTLEEPRGDPALFALSWARLLDGAVLPPEGLVPAAERLAAGEPFTRAPLPGPPVEHVAPARTGLEAWLAAAAAVATIAAVSVLGRG